MKNTEMHFCLTQEARGEQSGLVALIRVERFEDTGSFRPVVSPPSMHLGYVVEAVSRACLCSSLRGGVRERRPRE